MKFHETMNLCCPVILRFARSLCCAFLTVVSFALITGGALMMSIKSYAPLVTGIQRPLTLILGLGCAVMAWAVVHPENP